MNAQTSQSRKQTSPKRILVRQVNWLGDAVMTIPALLRLRESNPDAEITLLSHEKLRDLWLHQPCIDQLSTFAAAESPWAVGHRLKSQKFDTALIIPNSPRSALECWFARIPQRIGYERSWASWLLTKPVPRRPAHAKMHKRTEAEVKALVRSNPNGKSFRFPVVAHQAYDYLHLASQIGASETPVAGRLHVLPAEIEAVRSKFGIKEDGIPLFGLNAGAEYGPAKQWPTDRFIKAAATIRSQTRCRWLLFGTTGQAQLVSTIESGIVGAIPKTDASVPLNLAGKTSLREFIVLLRLCNAVLTNDSGPMHLAAAVGVPVVVPFGSTSPELTGPFMASNGTTILRGEAPCAPCFRRECPIDHRCMTSVPVDSVATHLARLTMMK